MHCFAIVSVMNNMSPEVSSEGTVSAASGRIEESHSDVGTSKRDVDRSTRRFLESQLPIS